MEQFVNLLFLLSFIPVFLIMIFMPFITRRNESFGVSIPVAMFTSPKLASIRKKYMLQTSILAAVILATYLVIGIWMSPNESLWAMMFSGTLVLFLIGSFAIYLTKHFEMKRLKSIEQWHIEKQQRVIIDTRFRQQALAYSNAWFIIPFIIFLGTIAVTFMFYDEIPQQIPLQYDFSGNVTNWAEKSVKSVLILPAMQLFLIGVFILTNVIITRAKQQLLVENPEKSFKQNVIFRRRWSIYTIATGTAVVLLFFFIQLSYTSFIRPDQLMIVILIFTCIFVIGAIALSIWTGQGGSRIKLNEMDHADTNEINQDEDQHWKLGQIYFNPSDPALFVEKRFGVGWTINLARPMAWFIFLTIILLAFGLPYLLSS